ncbi:calponin homology domain-containing protein [Mycena latifolia]|nr:calponin homology domain-containing protein [Mycena latifolia]
MVAEAAGTELLLWLNELLQLNYTKVEKCGTGGAYCHIIDSIYPGDVPMARVKMAAKHEYEYVANYKILQTVDNHELKKFWDANYSGEPYDVIARSKGAPADPPATFARARSTTAAAAGRAGGHTPLSGHRSTTPGHAGAGATRPGARARRHIEALEKERDFILRRCLRDIEVLMQAKFEELEAVGKDDETLGHIQKILYSAEEDFEVPEGTGDGAIDEERF